MRTIGLPSSGDPDFAGNQTIPAASDIVQLRADRGDGTPTTGLKFSLALYDAAGLVVQRAAMTFDFQLIDVLVDEDGNQIALEGATRTSAKPYEVFVPTGMAGHERGGTTLRIFNLNLLPSLATEARIYFREA